MVKAKYKVPIEILKEGNIKPEIGIKIALQTESGEILKPATITKIEKEFVIVSVEE